MKILVVGGTQFIGPVVVNHLVAGGHQVAVYHRGQTACDGLPDDVEHILGDRDDLLDRGDDIARFAPDVVVHMILGTAQDAWRARLAFEGVVERLVLVSSMDVYRAYGRLRGTERGRHAEGPPGQGPICATTGPLRACLYPYRDDDALLAKLPEERVARVKDYDKIPIEQLLNASQSMQVTTLRLPMVHGPRDAQHRLHSLLKRMEDGRETILCDAQQLDWRVSRGFVDDVGRAIAAAALTPFDGHRCFNVGDTTALTERAWIEAVAEAVGWRGDVVGLPNAQLPEHLQSDHNFEHDVWCETRSTHDALRLPEPSPLAEQLAVTVAWARANPPEAFDEADFDYAAEDAAILATS